MDSVEEISAVSEEPIDLATAKRFLRLPASAAPDDDDITNIFIPGARRYVERATGLVLANRDFVQYEDGFPSQHGEFGFDPLFGVSFLFAFGAATLSAYDRHTRQRSQRRLLRMPVTAIDHIDYIGTDGISHTLQPGEDFAVDYASFPARVAPLPGGTWPIAMRGLGNVRIYYSAGYKPLQAAPIVIDDTANQPSPPKGFGTFTFQIAIPEHLYAAILQIIVHWYQNRDVIIATAGAGGQHAPIPHQFDAIVNLERVLDFSNPEL